MLHVHVKKKFCICGYYQNSKIQNSKLDKIAIDIVNIGPIGIKLKNMMLQERFYAKKKMFFKLRFWDLKSIFYIQNYIFDNIKLNFETTMSANLNWKIVHFKKDSITFILKFKNASFYSSKWKFVN